MVNGMANTLFIGSQTPDVWQRIRRSKMWMFRLKQPWFVAMDAFTLPDK